MDILSGLVVGGGSAAFVLHLIRQARRREALIQPRFEEADRLLSPSTDVEPSRHRRPDPSPPAGAGREDTRGSYLVGSLRDGDRGDATAAMMETMAGPGFCTPRP